MSCAKTRARSFAQPMRRGLGEDVGEEAAGSLGRATPKRGSVKVFTEGGV